MDWTQWGKGEERAQSSAACEILEASLIGRLRASSQCQLAQWSWIWAGELSGYFIVIPFSLCSYSPAANIPKEIEVSDVLSQAFLSCGRMHM